MTAAAGAGINPIQYQWIVSRARGAASLCCVRAGPVVRGVGNWVAIDGPPPHPLLPSFVAVLACTRSRVLGRVAVRVRVAKARERGGCG
jgi:hypothetical protein